MFKSFLAVVLCLFASVSFAGDQCTKRSLKIEVETCYKQLVQEREVALREYYDSIMGSPKIPAHVKTTIHKDYRSFMRNIYTFCPNNSCVEAAMMEQLKDMYAATREYIIP